MLATRFSISRIFNILDLKSWKASARTSSKTKGIAIVSTLHYFVDTNLFIQCRSLEELDWSHLNSFDEVQLIVTYPVLQEIDHIKNKGTGRVGKRARATAAIFRKMREEKTKLIRKEGPQVILSVEAHYTCEQKLKNRLNYEERDNQLIGILYKFAHRHPKWDARILTHDTILLYTADGLDLKVDMIPDGWLLQPENTEIEKELIRLTAENKRLKAAEPSFAIRCADRSNSQIGQYETTYVWFDPLSEVEIQEIMQRLKSRFPLHADFNSKEAQENISSQSVLEHLLRINQVFTPASKEDIEKYRDEHYPSWLNECDRIFQNHHQVLQQKNFLQLHFFAENQGICSAKDVLVTIKAFGNFQIRPIQPEYSDNEQHGEPDERSKYQIKKLPRPPLAPSGHWRAIADGLDLNTIANSLRGFSEIEIERIINPSRWVSESSFIKGPFSLDSLSHDPNAFYFKPSFPDLPQDSFQLECEQWRHRDGEECFGVEIHMPLDEEQVEGALAFQIQADNLSDPVCTTIPIRISIEHKSAYESACSMANVLLAAPL